ncbi:hypothetical protein GCM10007870_20680 [Gluconobacter kondonii]|uniref:Transposase n=1 Tax=Gluconobacter kondonii TaxID=941463 RepID=A0ABQ5WSY7_9PROT|nr:hypothetical protein GCM10007870_20680 [Gluconobacter kondonii]
MAGAFEQTLKFDALLFGDGLHVCTRAHGAQTIHAQNRDILAPECHEPVLMDGVRMIGLDVAKGFEGLTKKEARAGKQFGQKARHWKLRVRMG